MCCGHELHATLCYSPCCQRLRLGANLVNNYHLWGVVLNRFYHHPVLLIGLWYLHTHSGTAGFS